LASNQLAHVCLAPVAEGAEGRGLSVTTGMFRSAKPKHGNL